MVANINLEKAYDRIDWSCLHSTKMSVLWNGSKLEVFKQERGLRQGDPLSLTSSFCV